MEARKSTAADKAEARRQLAESLQQSITDKVAELTDTGAWKAYLDAAQSFYSYSFKNLILILSQRPTRPASLVTRSGKQVYRALVA